MKKTPWNNVVIALIRGVVLGLVLGLCFLLLSKCFAKTAPENNYNTTETTAEVIETTTQKESLISLGVFKATAYCPCMKCCGNCEGITASGTQATEGRTIAVDPNLIPYGTKLYINGNEYIAEDCGGAIKENRIDIFFNSHDEALAFGVKELEVFILA